MYNRVVDNVSYDFKTYCVAVPCRLYKVRLPTYPFSLDPWCFKLMLDCWFAAFGISRYVASQLQISFHTQFDLGFTFNIFWTRVLTGIDWLQTGCIKKECLFQKDI